MTVEIIYRYEDRSGEPARPQDAEAARRRLDDGNRAFAALFDSRPDQPGLQHVVLADLRDLSIGTAGGSGAVKQRPFAAVLGCCDARVPTELIFNELPNDLFVVRVAGNGLGSDALGSLNYAIEHLGESLKLVVVLRHSGCGAVSAAVDIFLKPAGYLPLATNHALRGIVDALLAVVHASSRKLLEIFGPNVARRRGFRQALIEVSIVINAAVTAHMVQRQIASFHPSSGVQTLFGVYLLETRRVWTPSRGGPDAAAGLADAPADAASFVELGHAAATSDRIASILEA